MTGLLVLLLPVLLFLLLLLLLLLAGGILSPPQNDPPRDTTVEGDEGLVPSRSEPLAGSDVSGFHRGYGRQHRRL